MVSGEIARIYHEWQSDKGAQLVFLDRSVPSRAATTRSLPPTTSSRPRRFRLPRTATTTDHTDLQDALAKYNPSDVEAMRAAQRGGWNAYAQIKRNLIERGIPENEIRFIQEANTDEQKQQIFDAVKAGDVRSADRLDAANGRRHERTGPSGGAASRRS